MQKPNNNRFSSGPCSKYPGWNGVFVQENVHLLGRSHRCKEVQALINDVNELSAELLKLPKDYKIAIIGGSDTGAFESAMWNMLGQRPVDLIYFEAFGKDWYRDVTKQLRLDNVREFSAPFGEFPDISDVNFDNDVVFTLNGTTSGVCFDHLDYIPDDRSGLTLCDATSAIYSIDIDFSKLDVITYSWQKSLGGEAQHGVMIVSPRAIERLNDYHPSRPIPKIYQIQDGESFNEKVFTGSVINTTSTICLLDAFNVLNWIKDNGGSDAMFARVAENFRVASSAIDNSSNFENLCLEKKYQSKTSVCFRIKHQWFKDLSNEEQKKIVNEIVSILEKEEVAFDVKGYKSAPPSFRVWCGLTIESEDLKHLFNWFESAYDIAVQKR
ncbi:MAG: phosphoserine transaminase [Rickettsiales bacterium]|nr:phosphoserine transaminase [Rickettsiales bacterium]